MEISDWRSFKPATPRAHSMPSMPRRWNGGSIEYRVSREPALRRSSRHSSIQSGVPLQPFHGTHLKRLIERYQARGVRFLAAPLAHTPRLRRHPSSCRRSASEDGALARRAHSSPRPLISTRTALLYYGRTRFRMVRERRRLVEPCWTAPSLDCSRDGLRDRGLLLRM